MPEHPEKPMTKRPADAVPEPKYSIADARSIATALSRDYDVRILDAALRVVEAALAVKEAMKLHPVYSVYSLEAIMDAKEGLAAALSEWKE